MRRQRLDLIPVERRSEIMLTLQGKTSMCSAFSSIPQVYNVNVACCFGGGSKWEQSKVLSEGAEIVVATPGRMIDMIKMKATNLERVTFLVLDEADRMFDMGFEPQVRDDTLMQDMLYLPYKI